MLTAFRELRTDASCSVGQRNRRTHKKTSTSTIANHGVWPIGEEEIVGGVSWGCCLVRFGERSPPFISHSKLLDAFRRTVKTNRSRFIHPRKSPDARYRSSEANDPCSFRFQFYWEQLSLSRQGWRAWQAEGEPNAEKQFHVFKFSRARRLTISRSDPHAHLKGTDREPNCLRHNSNDIPGRFWIPHVFDTASFDSSGIFQGS